MTYKLLENEPFSKGDRVVATRDIKLHFGGVIKKGDTGTYLLTELIGTKKMDKGRNG